MIRGVKTSEFWVSTITAIAISVMGLLVGYKFLTSEQSELWMGLIIAVVPAALSAISYGYSKSRASVKESSAWAMENNARWQKIEVKDNVEA